MGRAQDLREHAGHTYEDQALAGHFEEPLRCPHCGETAVHLDELERLCDDSTGWRHHCTDDALRCAGGEQ